MKKIIASLLCFIVALTVTITAFGADIQLFNNNVSNVYTDFSVNSNGYATVTNKFTGIPGVTKSTEVETKIQKKFGLIWITVSGASWTDTTSSSNFMKSHYFQLSSTGTYRAHVVFKVSGTGGSDDKITKNVERAYS